MQVTATEKTVDSDLRSLVESVTGYNRTLVEEVEPTLRVIASVHGAGLTEVRASFVKLLMEANDKPASIPLLFQRKYLQTEE